MKKLILVLAILMIGIGAFAQRTISDTIYGAETVSFSTMTDARLVTAKCTTLGDSIAGTLAIYGSIDGTNFTFLNYLSGDLGVASPKASLAGAELNQITMANNLISTWNILKDNLPYHKIVGAGTAANDTTLVTIIWSK